MEGILEAIQLVPVPQINRNTLNVLHFVVPVPKNVAKMLQVIRL